MMHKETPIQQERNMKHKETELTEKEKRQEEMRKDTENIWRENRVGTAQDQHEHDVDEAKKRKTTATTVES